MSKTTALLQQQQQLQQKEHNIELMCRICAVDFRIANEGVSILTTEQLMDKIRNYLHIQVNNLDKLSHLVCNECVRKIENFHCYALMAQKNQELFNIMYSEKIYREHCTALSSLNTTLYREPPTPQTQQVQTKFNELSKPQPAIKSQSSPPIKKPKLHTSKPSALSLLPPASVISSTIAQENSQQQGGQQPVAVLSTEDITIFTYQDLKLGQVIKDQELQKLILRALKWNEAGKSIESQLDRLKNTSFRAVLNNPDLLRDEDLVQLLGPYLDHGSFAALDTNKSANIEFSSNSKFMDQNVTEMEVGVDPDLFFPYDDEESSKGMDIEVTKVVQKPKKERKKSEAKTKTTNKKTSMAGSSSSSSPSSTSIIATIVTPSSTSGKIRVKPESQLFNTAIVPTTTIAQSTLIPEKPIPKPIIVIPTPKPVIRQTNVQAQQSKTKKQEMAVPSAAVQIIPEPIITAPSKIVQAPKSTVIEVAPAPIIKIPIPPKPEVTIELEPPATNSSQPLQVPEKLSSTTKASAASTSVVTSTVTTVNTTKSTTKSNVNKPELKPKLQRKVKIDDTKIGPKTRARSVFNARHKCNVAGCSRKFSTMSNLKAHIKTHKPKGKFICSIQKCSRIFKTEANLIRHKEYHAGENRHKEYSCRTCNRVYPSNSTLKQHEIAHSNVRNFECNVCLKSFKRSQDLKFHINQHTGSRPYQCPYCPKAFASSGNCFSHRKRVHLDKTITSPAITVSKRISSIETSNNKKLVKA